MKKTTKIWLIIATALVLIGCGMWLGVMMTLEWNWGDLSTMKYETKLYEINEDFNALSLTTDVADVTILPSEDGKCVVECYEQAKVEYSVQVEDDTLVISSIDTRKWYEFISINVGSPKITVYLPKKEFSSLFQVKTSTGRILIENFNVGSLDLNASTGKVSLENVNAGSLDLKTSTGKVLLSNVICEGAMEIQVSTGDVTFDACDAAELFVKTSTGNVSGTLLSEKIIFAASDTGRVSVPKSTTGGRCEITTSTGNINIEILE